MGKLAWFLAGTGFGAVAGVLYAPKSGAETREAIRSKADEGREYVKDKTQRVKDQAQQVVEKGKRVVSEQKDNVRGAVEAGRQAYQDATMSKTGTQG